MWVTKAGAVQDIEDGTFPYWRSQGWVEWQPDATGGSSPVGVGDFTRWEHDGVADATSGNFDFVADQLATAGTSISVDDSADWITNWGVPVPQVTVDGLYTIVHYADATANTVGSIDIQFVDADTTNIDGTPIPPTVAPFVVTGVDAQAVYTLTEWLVAGTHIIVDVNTGPGTLNQERLLIRKVG